MLNNEDETAFPAERRHDGSLRQGMSMRDYFAAATLTGLNANPIHEKSDYCDLAIVSYKQADAMMEARKKLG